MSAAKRQHTCAVCAGSLDLQHPETISFETLIDDVVRVVCVHTHCTTHPKHATLAK